MTIASPMIQEKAILVGLLHDGRRRALEEESLEELRELAVSAGAEAQLLCLQERKKPDPAYLIGRGKMEEVRELIEASSSDLVIFNEDLSPAQLRNLEAELHCKVIDRSELILDIFAQRARSAEGKLQVELAQMEYLLPRLTGKGSALSRLGGGIGTRGPGETKLEVDRRRIRRRISSVKKDLAALEDRRALQRQKRRSIPLPTVGLVGYTNAGKSTLFNRLTRERTYVSPRMFATLDPLVRKRVLPSGQEILIGDTVGFIRKLPHALVAAFHATLEEALDADLLLHVIDISHEDWPALRTAVYDVLEEIGTRRAPIVEVYNKVDLVPSLSEAPSDSAPLGSARMRVEVAGEKDESLAPHPERVFVSALTGEGIPRLLAVIAEEINKGFRTVSLLVPFERGDIASQIRERGRVRKQDYRSDGIYMEASLPVADVGRFRPFLCA